MASGAAGSGSIPDECTKQKAQRLVVFFVWCAHRDEDLLRSVSGAKAVRSAECAKRANATSRPRRRSIPDECCPWQGLYYSIISSFLVDGSIQVLKIWEFNL